MFNIGSFFSTSVYTRCQKAVLNEAVLNEEVLNEAMLNKLGPERNIARNTALSENVFLMVVCIELRIPLFVVGKPGSSKSLAKTVVAANMEGDASKSDLFKTFKQVTLMFWQDDHELLMVYINSRLIRISKSAKYLL